MEIKLIELRDQMTFIPAMAIKISSDDGWLARRAGYGSPCILFGRAEGGVFRYDPYEWGDRTFAAAHHFIIEHWEDIHSGQLVDARVCLGETDAPCKSEKDENFF